MHVMGASSLHLWWISKKARGAYCIMLFIPQITSADMSYHRQMNMDYSLSSALSLTLNGLKRVFALYDIMCQYGVNLRRRFESSEFLSLPPDITIQHGIGIWHVNGHLPDCFCRFCPLFIKGAGNVDGEILETLWSSLNEISGSTRAMTASHRQEILDDHMNYSNWGKLVRIGQ